MHIIQWMSIFEKEILSVEKKPLCVTKMTFAASAKSSLIQWKMKPNTFYHLLSLPSSYLTFRATKSHDQRAVALVELPEASTASSISDDGQLFQDESLVTNTQNKSTLEAVIQTDGEQRSSRTDKTSFLCLGFDQCFSGQQLKSAC